MSVKPASWRLLCWGLVAVVMVTDAIVATPVGLTLLYAVPIALAALRVSRLDALSVAAVAAIGRMLFGPTGDPLGLRTVTLEVPPEARETASIVVSVASYVIIAVVVSRLRQQQARIEALADEVATDPLTRVGNRRALDRRLSSPAPASLLVADVDHFKRINDTWGHDTGDRILQELARRLSAAVRSGDLVARIGGEEFVLLLPGADPDSAREIAERVCAAVRERPFESPSGDIPVTVSVGVATGLSSTELLKSADAAVYAAKSAGRDRVCAA